MPGHRAGRATLPPTVKPRWNSTGVGLSHLTTAVSIQPSDQLRGGQNGVYTYWVGTEVKKLDKVPHGMSTLTIPGQTYALTTIRGGADQIDSTYIALVQWIQAPGRATNPNSFGFNRYDNRRQKVHRITSNGEFGLPAFTRAGLTVTCSFPALTFLWVSWPGHVLPRPTA